MKLYDGYPILTAKQERAKRWYSIFATVTRSRKRHAYTRRGYVVNYPRHTLPTKGTGEMKKRLEAYLATTYLMWQLGQNKNDGRYALQWMRYQGRFEGAKEVANALGYRVCIINGAVVLRRNSATRRKAVGA